MSLTLFVLLPLAKIQFALFRGKHRQFLHIIDYGLDVRLMIVETCLSNLPKFSLKIG